MKRVKKWVYYCEHCKKSGRSASHMARHEQRCTGNPDRECGMCGVLGDTQEDYRVVVATLRERFGSDIDAVKEVIAVEIERDGWSATRADINDGKEHEYNLPTAKDIDALIGECPACILTVIRMLDIAALIKFSWAEHRKDWQDAYNESQY